MDNTCKNCTHSKEYEKNIITCDKLDSFIDSVFADSTIFYEHDGVTVKDNFCCNLFELKIKE